MYKKILVTLDGSELAEAALDHAAQLACDMGSGVVLLMVAPPPTQVITAPEDVPPAGSVDRPSLYWAPYWAPYGPPPIVPLDDAVVRHDNEFSLYVDQQEDKIRARLTSYLSQVGEKVSRCGAKVTPVVAFGDPAGQIIDYAAGNDVDIIVMATHGRGGVGRWLVGSVAEKSSEAQARRCFWSAAHLAPIRECVRKYRQKSTCCIQNHE